MKAFHYLSRCPASFELDTLDPGTLLFAGLCGLAAPPAPVEPDPAPEPEPINPWLDPEMCNPKNDDEGACASPELRPIREEGFRTLPPEREALVDSCREERPLARRRLDDGRPPAREMTLPLVDPPEDISCIRGSFTLDPPVANPLARRARSCRACTDRKCVSSSCHLMSSRPLFARVVVCAYDLR